jgi:hypothetical protein
MFCSSCGTKLPSESKFCPDCGARNVSLPSEANIKSAVPAATTVRSALEQDDVCTPKFRKTLVPFLNSYLPNFLDFGFRQSANFHNSSFKDNDFVCVIQAAEGILFLSVNGIITTKLKHNFFPKDEVREIELSGYLHLTQLGFGVGKHDKVKFTFVTNSEQVVEIYMPKPWQDSKAMIHLRNVIQILEMDYQIKRGPNQIADELPFGFWRN